MIVKIPEQLRQNSSGIIGVLGGGGAALGNTMGIRNIKQSRIQKLSVW